MNNSSGRWESAVFAGHEITARRVQAAEGCAFETKSWTAGDPSAAAHGHRSGALQTATCSTFQPYWRSLRDLTELSDGICLQYRTHPSVLHGPAGCCHPFHHWIFSVKFPTIQRICVVDWSMYSTIQCIPHVSTRNNPTTAPSEWPTEKNKDPIAGNWEAPWAILLSATNQNCWKPFLSFGRLTVS
jgi:hypothetical protein